tara:strand:+ start:460 stop:1023 length:564 start_codon:yes stop_codon:yes gene_type:complete
MTVGSLKDLGKTFGLIALLVAQPAQAQQGSAGPEARALMEAALSESSLQSQSKRDHLVEAISAYCAKLSREMPTNSPREDDWLRRELDGSGERQMKALSSPEWSRLMAANFISGCTLYSQSYSNDKAIGLAGLTQVFAKYAPDLADYERITKTEFEHLALGGVKYHTANIAFASLMQSANVQNAAEP